MEGNTGHLWCLLSVDAEGTAAGYIHIPLPAAPTPHEKGQQTGVEPSPSPSLEIPFDQYALSIY